MMLICISRPERGCRLDVSICEAVCTIRPCRWPLVQTFAGYTIVRLLGSGGMGEVYLAAASDGCPARTRSRCCRPSVSADAEYRQRFNREADIAATLWHPHIVGVHDRGEVRRPDLDLDGLRGRAPTPRELLATSTANGMPHGRGRSRSSPRSPRRSTTPTSATCCTATSNPPTSCSPIRQLGGAANPAWPTSALPAGPMTSAA